ncbi:MULTISPECIES: sensor histidine kinase [Microvirga]|uniref:sensor histidine kinase n=1 Tax=Microvirga TaxID=186650 RepID=UPI001CFE489C|nr:HAMP domain-containing sensor histidine kinase [Microvirga lenta]MCB5173865.1 HAMP domain-containing histidine kinase [Microvirga lenta]
MPESKTPPEKHPRPNKTPPGNEARRDPSRHLDRMSLLAHQLMTPLSTISTLAQGLMRRANRLSTEDVQERSEKIWRASLRLQELIETIMSYTRINSGALTPSLNLFNLENLVRRVCQEHRNQELSRPFQTDLQDLPDVFVGDPVLLEQALAIILSNAMKYSPVDCPIIVRSRKRDGNIMIEVTDQGMGVPEGDLPYLMQPFFRGRNVKHMPGTGLGLSLVWHILKLHGGSVRLDSKEGAGTTVALILPDGSPVDLGADI